MLEKLGEFQYDMDENLNIQLELREPKILETGETYYGFW